LASPTAVQYSYNSVSLQLSIGKMIKINKFENRFPKAKTGFSVFD